MIFNKWKKKVWKWMKKMDKVVTSIIIWGAVVSIFWLSKTKKWKRITWRLFDLWKNTFKTWYSLFWKTLAKSISFLFKKK